MYGVRAKMEIYQNYESPEGSFEIRDSISEIRDSKFNIPINQWVEIIMYSVQPTGTWVQDICFLQFYQ
jgi:hypothetical protein